MIPLPHDRTPLLPADPKAPCGHLAPVLADLVGRGARVLATPAEPGGYRSVLLDVPLVRDDVGARFDLPGFVTWGWADPHYGTGNTLSCTVCRCALEGCFDPRDPARSLGLAPGSA